MKLGQKELNSLTMLYGTYKNLSNESNEDYNIFYGINRTILTLGIETEVKNNWYKFNHKLGSKQIETIEKLLKKAMPERKIILDDTMLNTYLDEIEFMYYITENEKTELKNAIKFLFELNENEKKFKEKYNL